MKKFYLFAFALVGVLVLAACGGSNESAESKKEITVAVQLESSKDILEIAKKK